MANIVIKQYDLSKPPRGQSNYSRRIQKETWDDVMPFIVEMFRAKLTRKEILKQLSTKHNFNPSMGQLVQQMTLWHMNRYSPRDVAAPITKSPAYTIPHDIPIYNLTSFSVGHGLHFDPVELQVHLDPGQVWYMRQCELASYWNCSFFAPRRFTVPDGYESRSLEATHYASLSFNTLKLLYSPEISDLLRPHQTKDRTEASASGLQHGLETEILFGRVTQILLHADDNGLKYNIGLMCLMLALAVLTSMRDDHDTTKSHVEAAKTIWDGILHNAREIRSDTTELQSAVFSLLFILRSHRLCGTQNWVKYLRSQVKGKKTYMP